MIVVSRQVFDAVEGPVVVLTETWPRGGRAVIVCRTFADIVRALEEMERREETS